MNLIIAAIVLAALAALLDWWIGIAQPWKNVMIAGIAVLFIFGVLLALGLLPFRLGTP